MAGFAGAVCHAAGPDAASGVNPQAVSLPSGPGTIRGIGEDFEPTLNTGTAKYDVPLELPRGPAGFTPGHLGLRYDSGHGNGILGFGWTLDVPHVRRRDFKPLPRYLDEPGPNGEPADRFVSDLHDAPMSLVPREDGYYFGEREGAFTRYRRDGGAWEAQEPTGVVMRFGDSEEARIEHPDGAGTYAWMVEERRDLSGNTIRYHYTTFDEEANANQLYLDRVEYGAGAPPWDAFHFVKFEYEERPDITENCRAGFCILTGMRLASIVVGSQGLALPELHVEGDFNDDGEPDQLVRRYDLAYDAHDHWSLLTGITLVGADGVSAMPPMRMEYTLSEPPDTADARDALIVAENAPTRLFDNARVELTELNGDGLPDLLETNLLGGPHKAYINEGETGGTPRAIRWSGAREIGGDARAWNVALGGPEGVTAHLSDIDGDGRADLSLRSGQFSVYYFPQLADPATGAITWGTRRPMNLDPGQVAPPTPIYDPETKRVDVNDDKLADIVQVIDGGSVVQMRVWINQGGDRYLPPYTLDTDLGFSFGMIGVHYADFNGDAIPDFLRLSVRGLEVTPGLGYGYLGEPYFFEIEDMLLTDEQRARAEFVDITGDGLPELVIERAVPGELWYWENLGYYEMAPRRVVTHLPAPVSLNATVRWADFNGNGTTDLAYADTQASPRMRIIDLGELVGAVPAPNLITAIENGIGRRIEISHRSSGGFALADRQAGAPWPDPMPFTVDVVDAVAVYDSLGGEYIKRYRYAGGFYDTKKRMFAGFTDVVVEDEGDATAPTEVLRHQFSVGRDHFQMAGVLERISRETLEGGVFHAEENVWTADVLYTSEAGHDVVYPRLDRKDKTAVELGVGDPVTTRYEYAYDDVGNLTRTREIPGYAPGQATVPAGTRTLATDYLRDEALWLVRLPERVRLYEPDTDGALVHRTEHFYDDEEFSGVQGPLTRGLETMVLKYADPGDDTTQVAEKRARHDAAGNPIVLIDALARADNPVDPGFGHYREVAYDSDMGAVPVLETIHVGGGAEPLEISAEYNLGFGVVTAAIGFGGHRTDYGYDVFGRLSQTWRPGDDADFPSLEYVYAPAVDLADGGTLNYVETRLLDQWPGAAEERLDHYHRTREFMDGLGRRLMKRSEASADPDSGAPRVAVSFATTFNGRGEVSALVEPHFTTLGGDLEDLLAFEDITAPGWTGLFHEDGALVAHPLGTAHQTTHTYDAVMRERTVTLPDGAVNEKRYEVLATRVFDDPDLDPASPFFDTPVVHRYDGLGRLAGVEEITRAGDGATLETWTTRYTQRADDLLLHLIDAQGNEKWWEYDGLGRKTRMVDYNRGELRWTYDAVGNLIETADAKGNRTAYLYDGVNRVIAEYDADADPSDFDPTLPISGDNRPRVAYFHDDPAGALDLGGGEIVEATGTRGKLAYLWDEAGELHHSHDPRGNLVWLARRTTDPRTGGPAWYRTTMAYDAQDRMAALGYPDGDQATYTYTDGGQLAMLGGGPTGTLLHGTDYTPADKAVRRVYGNGVVSEFAFDARQRLIHLRAHPEADPATPLLDQAYTYDAASNMIAIDDLRPAAVVPDGDPRRNAQQFTYDDRNRLRAASFSFGLPGEAAVEAGRVDYALDRLGNLVEQTSTFDHSERGFPTANLGPIAYGGDAGASGRVGRNPGDAPGPHAATQIGEGDDARAIVYDDNGNVTAFDGFTLTHDARDRLVAVEDAGMRAEYTYDHSGRRAIKRVWAKDDTGALADAPRDTVTYVDLHFEVRRNDQATKYVYHGGQRVAKITGTLDPTRHRAQWLRLMPGWNIVALAVDAPDAAAQLALADDPALTGAFLIDADTGEAVAIEADTPLPVGSVLWINAAEAHTPRVIGAYTDPAAAAAQLGHVLPGGLEPVDLAQVLPGGVGPVWAFDPVAQAWVVRAGAELPGVDGLPPTLLPGQPVYLHLDAPAELGAPPADRAILYYHPDHIQSTAVLSDAAGAVAEEIAYFPYGATRNQHQPGAPVENPYQFAQKERDRETGLHYFEARYFASPLARFLQVDPVTEALPEAALLDPQALQAYGYGRGNPLTYRDPTGRFLQTAIGKAKIREANPYRDSDPANKGKSLAERRARIFGELKLDKGSKLPTPGPTASSSVKAMLKGEEAKLSEANTVLSSIAQIAENLSKSTKTGGEAKLDVGQILKTLTQDRKVGGAVPDGATLTEGGKIAISSDTFIDKFVSKDFAKLIDGLDFDAKFKELSGIADKALEKQGFDFKTAEVESFIAKYLDTSDGATTDGTGAGSTDSKDSDKDSSVSDDKDEKDDSD